MDELCEDTWVAFDETPVAGSPAAALAHGEWQTVKVPDENGNLIDFKLGEIGGNLGSAPPATRSLAPCRVEFECCVVEKSGLMRESSVYTVLPASSVLPWAARLPNFATSLNQNLSCQANQL